MELKTIKLLSALALIIFTSISSMLPLCIFRQPLSLYDPPDRYNTRRSVMSYLSCFAGGVFLGTCLLHLFPDVTEEVNHMMESLHLNCTFPVAEFLLSFGFLFILAVEQIVLKFKEPVVNNERTSLIHSEPTENQNLVPEKEHDFEDSAENSHYIVTTYGAIQGQNQPDELNISFIQPQDANSIFHSLLLLFALSLHSVFEGLAIGMQKTVRDDLRILLAVLIHKCIIAFSLGLKLTHSEMRISNVIKSSMFFSLSSPVGILIGMVVINLVKGVALTITSSILQGIAAGTFLYVTLFEILSKEFDSPGDRILKLLSVIVGYVFVTILAIALPD